MIIITEIFKAVPAQSAGTAYESTHPLHGSDGRLAYLKGYRSEWYHSGSGLYPSKVATAASKAPRR